MNEEEVPVNRQDVLSGSLSLGLAVFVFVKAFELGHGEFSNPGAGFVLLWSSVVLGVLALVLILKGSLGRARAKRLLEPFAGLRWTNALITVAAGILYALLM
ncbi:MAG: hypothetical protein HY900_18080, partial [Deltaproteobacteria bacterium]|nr:hypothetical protein [Deltaproteobacteria bacterium]